MSKYRFSLSERSKENLKGVDLDLLKVVNRAIQITKVDFGIPATGGLRTAKQQQALFEKGKTKLDGINYRSEHQKGRAVDFFAYKHHRATWDEDQIRRVALAFYAAASELGIPIEWGGWWKINDMVHIQLPEDHK